MSCGNTVGGGFFVQNKTPEEDRVVKEKDLLRRLDECFRLPPLMGGMHNSYSRPGPVF